jgi:hypothetical protein
MRVSYETLPPSHPHAFFILFNAQVKAEAQGLQLHCFGFMAIS